MKFKRIMKKITFILLLFYIGSIIGYIYEIIYCLVKRDHFVNRGALYGPWLPIYGIGMCFLTLFKPIKKNYILVFLLTMISMGGLEYLIGLLFLKVFNKRYWDYRDNFLNLDGLICFESVLAFTIGGILFIYVLYPLYEKLYKKMDQTVVNIIDYSLGVLMITDIVVTAVIKY